MVFAAGRVQSERRLVLEDGVVDLVFFQITLSGHKVHISRLLLCACQLLLEVLIGRRPLQGFAIRIHRSVPIPLDPELLGNLHLGRDGAALQHRYEQTGTPPGPLPAVHAPSFFTLRLTHAPDASFEHTPLLRPSFVNRARDKQDVRDRRGPKAEVRGSENLEPSSVRPFLSAPNPEPRTQNFFAHLAPPALLTSLASLARITRYASSVSRTPLAHVSAVLVRCLSASGNPHKLGIPSNEGIAGEQRFSGFSRQ